VLGIVDPRQLDEDAVCSLALDRRLLGTGLVDAAANDLDRLIDRLPGSILRSAWRASSMRPGSRSVKAIASPSTLSPVYPILASRKALRTLSMIELSRSRCAAATSTSSSR
jgi:hypothetical protein